MCDQEDEVEDGGVKTKFRLRWQQIVIGATLQEDRVLYDVRD
jgi:hypothetical protein